MSLRPSVAKSRPAKDENPAEHGIATFVVPDLSIKDLLSVIPAHCFKRSALRSSVYVVWDFFLLAAIYKATITVEPMLEPSKINYPHPALYNVAWCLLWAAYSWITGLVATGLWVIAHECGHQAFSESKTINNTVGWILHSALGVPYHSWRISHARHHASTGHMTQDQVFVPKTRSQVGLPPIDTTREDIYGENVSIDVMEEMWEALGDSPLATMFWASMQLLVGWPLYLIRNASGQRTYPSFTNHFKPSSVIFKPSEYSQIIVSDIGVLLWLGGITYWSVTRGFWEMARVYGFTYLWVNHWLVLITFLQHTSPMLPHYRVGAFNFQRGALATLDRSLMGGAGQFWGWLGGFLTHGISETHVLHHVSSKIPHYNAWEASDALRKRLADAGLYLQGPPGGWTEVYNALRTCRFVEDEGDVVFYKDAYGRAQCKPVFPEGFVSDSGIDLK